MNLLATLRIFTVLGVGLSAGACHTKHVERARPETDALETPDTAYSRANSVGHTLYMQHCSACHGDKGYGDGPVAHAYCIAPPDLSRIAERNQGSFPFMDIVDVIEGRRAIDAHGYRQMPVWGIEFRKSAWQAGLSEESRIIADGNLLALASWLERIQAGPSNEREN